MLNFDSWLNPFHCGIMGKLLTLPKTYFPVLQSRNMRGTNDGVLWELNATICLKHLVDCDHCLNFHFMYSQNTYSVPTKLILLWNVPLCFLLPNFLFRWPEKGKGSWSDNLIRIFFLILRRGCHSWKDMGTVNKETK